MNAKFYITILLSLKIYFCISTKIAIKLIFLNLFVSILSINALATPWDDDPIHLSFYNSTNNDIENMVNLQVETSNNILENHNTNCTFKFPNPPLNKIVSVPSLPDDWILGGPNDNHNNFSPYLSEDNLNIIYVNNVKIYKDGEYENFGGICVQVDEEYYIVIPTNGSPDCVILHETGHRAGLSHVENDENNVMDDDGGAILTPEQINTLQNLFGTIG